MLVIFNMGESKFSNLDQAANPLKLNVITFAQM